MKTWLKIVAAAGLAFSTTVAADPTDPTLNLRWDSPVFNPFAYPDQISLSTDGGLPSRSVRAGRFQGTVLEVTGAISMSDFLDSPADFWTYCYDLLQFIHNGETVTYTVDYNGPTARTLDFLGAIDYVLNGNSNTWSDPFAWLHPVNHNVSAAIQIGIWESLYDTSGWSLNSGLFQASGLEAATLTQYAAFQTAVNSPWVNDLPALLALTIESGTRQDQITGRILPLQELPEPGSLALFALAGVLAAVTRRRWR